MNQPKATKWKRLKGKGMSINWHWFVLDPKFRASVGLGVVMSFKGALQSTDGTLVRLRKSFWPECHITSRLIMSCCMLCPLLFSFYVVI